MSPFSLLENSLHTELFEQLQKESDIHQLTNESHYSFQDLLRRVTKLLGNRADTLPPSVKNQILYSTVYRVIGFGVIQPLIEDTQVTEIMVNGKDTIFIEKNGTIQQSDIRFSSNDELLQVINRIVSRIGRRIDESSPMVDARLPDGSRVNAIIAPLSLIGPVLTIRKFPAEPFSLHKLIEYNSLTEEMAEFIEKCIISKQNIIISGGTGSGKTSFLNAASSFIPKNERIITIEDAAELQLNQPNLVSLETRPPNIEGKGAIPMRTLLKNALRMRPDRIIVGEIRGSEALDMLQAMNTGHKGSITTIHANAPLEALLRAETMMLMAESNLPLASLRSQIAKAVDIVIQIERFPTGERKTTRITEVCEKIEENGQSSYQAHDIFYFDKKNSTHKRTDYTPQCQTDFEYYCNIETS